MGSSVFYSSTVKEINIPASVTSIYPDIYNSGTGFTSIESFNVEAGNTVYESVDGVLFTKGQTELIRYPRVKPDSSYVIPDTVTNIWDSAFYNCDNLTEVTLSKNITSIGNNTFSDCSNLNSALFLGDAPDMFGTNVFYRTASGFIIYYTDTATGWTTPTWNGYNAVLITIERPVTPSKPVMTSRASKRIAFRWPATVSNVDILEYNVYRDNQLIGTVTGTSYTDTELVAEASYIYCVDAVDVAGKVSEKSESAEFSTVLPVIETFTQLADSYILGETSSVGLSARMKNDQNLQGLTAAFEYRNEGSTDWTQINTSISSGNFYANWNISGLSQGEYSIRIKVTDTDGASTSQEQSTSLIDPHVHVFGPWVTVREPSILNEGLSERTCTICGAKETMTTPKLEIDINQTDQYGLAVFTVVDAQTLAPINGASLFVSTTDDGEGTFNTNADGNVEQVLPVGQWVVSVYANGYLSREIRVTINSGTQELPNIGLSTKPLVEGKLTTHEMTYEEIIAAGIDVNAEGNNHVFKYEAEITFIPEIDWLSIFTYFNADGAFLGWDTDGIGPSNDGDDYIGTGGGTNGLPPFYSNVSTGGSGGGGSGGNGIGFKLSDGTSVTVFPVREDFYIIIYGEVHWLKEMYDVELLVINNSMTDTIEDSIATLHIPDGLSLAEMVHGEQSTMQSIPYVGHGESASVNWYIRGDVEGVYDISATLTGKMMPFEEEFNYQFTADSPIKVQAGSVMHLTFNIPDSAFYGEDYPIVIELTNVSGKPIYGVRHFITGLKQGKVTYYSDGTIKEEVYVDTGYLGSIGADIFMPGDKLVIELTTNIMFQSELIQSQLDKLKNMVSAIEQFKQGFEMFSAGIDFADSLIGFISNADKNISSVISTISVDDTDKLAAATELYDEVNKLFSKIAMSDSRALKAINEVQDTDVYEFIQKAANEADCNAFFNAASAVEIADMLKKVRAINNSAGSTTEFNAFDAIRNAIDLIPVRFVVSSFVLTTCEESTTEIPYSVNITPTGARYFGVDDIGSYVYSLMIAGFGKIESPWFLQPFGASDDITGYEDAVKHIIAVQEKASAYAAKDATGTTTFRAWVEARSDLNTQGAGTASVDASRAVVSNDFILASTNTAAVMEGGVLSFTGGGIIEVTPTSTNGGVLYIEMIDEYGNSTVKEYIMDVVPYHECSSSNWVVETSHIDGVAYKAFYCDICHELIGIELMEPCLAHSFGEYVTTLEPTTDAYGIRSRTCTICGHTEYEFIEPLVADTQAPSGSISIGVNEWNSFKDTVTFELISEDTQTVSIEATDNSEGVVIIQYYLSSSELTLDELNGVTVEWDDYSQAFDITPNSKYIIYVKLTDEAGNTAYINSSGIVVYTASNVLTEEIEYVKGSGMDAEATIELNNNTIAVINDGSNDLALDEDYALLDDTITFKSEWLDSLTVGEYTLTVHYNPLGIAYPENPLEGSALQPMVINLTVHISADDSAIANAKGLIEGSTYSVEQATANTEDAVKEWLVTSINALAGMTDTGITITENDITISNFIDAIAGTTSDIDGTDGSFSFTVSVARGAGTTLTTDSIEGSIIATAYDVSADNEAIATAKELIEGSTYSVEQATANTEGAVKAWLVTSINAFAGMTDTGITITENDITISNFIDAIAGTTSDIDGTDGSFSFTVSVARGAGTTLTTDSIDGSIIATPVIPVAPTITTTDLPDGTVDTPYSQALAATGDAPITWSDDGNLPSGLTLSDVGIISGTPAETGTFNFTVTATNSAGSDTQDLTLIINSAPVIPVAPTITTTTLPNGTVDTPYSQALAATGDAPITWSDDGNLPSGLTLSDVGVISGTPVEAGTFNFTVTATNSAGSDTQDLTLTINSAPVIPVAPTITTTTLPNGTVDTSYSQALAATGDAPITWSDDGNLPSGLTLSDVGVISGTPAAAGTFNFTVTAMNNAGSDTQDLTLIINSAPVEPTLYAVNFNVIGGNGTLSATVDDIEITSPSNVQEGKNVIFTAKPDTGYQVKEWRLGDSVIAGYTNENYTLTSVSARTTVTVEFELIYIFIAINDITGVTTEGTVDTPVTLNGTITPSNASNQTIIWGLGSGSTATGATVSNGQASASGVGTVVVTATVINGLAEGVNFTKSFTIWFDTWHVHGIIYEGDGYYYYQDGVKVTGFVEIDGIWRYFNPDENGKMAIGWDTVEGFKRYFAEDGAMLGGWHTVDGEERYFFEGSIVLEGYHLADGAWRLFLTDGVPHPAGFYLINDYWLYFGERGFMAPPGFYELDGKWRYIMDGSIVSPPGWYTLYGENRYIADGGILLPEGCYEIDEKWYYIMNGSIVAPPGWYTLYGASRYVADGGILLPEGFHLVDGSWRYILNGSIAASPGWYMINDIRRYVADNGVLLSPGWHEVDGALRYFLDGSIPASGLMTIDGVEYLFDEYGAPIG
jgi:glucan-binding YG repeat protein